MPRSAPSPHLEILQEVAVTPKECSRGGRLRPSSLDPLATAGFEARSRCGAARGTGSGVGSGLVGPMLLLLRFGTGQNRAVRNVA